MLPFSQISSLIFVLIILTSTNSEYVTFSSLCMLQIEKDSNSTDGSFKFINCFLYHAGMELTSDWAYCTNKCCDPYLSYDQKQRTLDSCGQDLVNFQDRQKIKRFFFFLGFFIAVFITFAVIFNCKKKKQNWNDNFPHLHPPSNVGILQSLCQSSTNLDDNKLIRWIQALQVNTDTCPICLEEGLDVEIYSCKHRIHGACWKEWIKSNKECVICRGKNIKVIKVYCKQCLKYYFICKHEDWQKIEDQTFTCIKCEP